MGRLRTKDFDLAPGYRRINGRVYYQGTTAEERGDTRQRQLDALPDNTPLVYFIRAQGSALKIGFTASKVALRRRLDTLQTGCPMRIRLVGAVVGTKADERRAHQLLSPYRSVGEWFRRPAVTAFMKRALQDGAIPEEL